MIALVVALVLIIVGLVIWDRCVRDHRGESDIFCPRPDPECAERHRRLPEAATSAITVGATVGEAMEELGEPVVLFLPDVSSSGRTAQNPAATQPVRSEPRHTVGDATRAALSAAVPGPESQSRSRAPI